MHYSRLALVAPALFVSVSAWGQSIIQNDCNFPVYYFEDNGTIPSGDFPLPILAPGQKYAKQLYQTGKPNGAGPSLKLAVADAAGNIPKIGGFYTGASQTQMEYTVDAPQWKGQINYDISNVNGNNDPPFKNYGLHLFVVQDPNNAQTSKTCDPGTVICQHEGQQNGYKNPTDDQASMCQTPMANDIQLTLCSANKGSGSGNSGNWGNSGNSGQASPAASPPASSSPPSVASPSPVPSPVKVENHQAVQSPVSSSPPEKQAQQQAGATVIITQTFTAPTVVETVHVLETREEKEKREEHIHAHANAHKKISKRRHGN